MFHSIYNYYFLSPPSLILLLLPFPCNIYDNHTTVVFVGGGGGGLQGQFSEVHFTFVAGGEDDRFCRVEINAVHRARVAWELVLDLLRRHFPHVDVPVCRPAANMLPIRGPGTLYQILFIVVLRSFETS